MEYIIDTPCGKIQGVKGRIENTIACDILSPPTLKLRGGSFLFKQSNDYSIYKLSPCVPRFFYIFSYCICASLNPSCSILRLAL